MAAVDAELQRHREIWHSFTRFLVGGTVAVIILLIFMAVFLV